MTRDIPALREEIREDSGSCPRAAPALFSASPDEDCLGNLSQAGAEVLNLAMGAVTQWATRAQYEGAKRAGLVPVGMTFAEGLVSPPPVVTPPPSRARRYGVREAYERGEVSPEVYAKVAREPVPSKKPPPRRPEPPAPVVEPAKKPAYYEGPRGEVQDVYVPPPDKIEARYMEGYGPSAKPLIIPHLPEGGAIGVITWGRHEEQELAKLYSPDEAAKILEKGQLPTGVKSSDIFSVKYPAEHIAPEIYLYGKPGIEWAKKKVTESKRDIMEYLLYGETAWYKVKETIGGVPVFGDISVGFVRGAESIVAPIAGAAGKRIVQPWEKGLGITEAFVGISPPKPSVLEFGGEMLFYAGLFTAAVKGAKLTARSMSWTARQAAKPWTMAAKRMPPTVQAEWALMRESVKAVPKGFEYGLVGEPMLSVGPTEVYKYRGGGALLEPVSGPISLALAKPVPLATPLVRPYEIRLMYQTGSIKIGGKVLVPEFTPFIMKEAKFGAEQAKLFLRTYKLVPTGRLQLIKPIGDIGPSWARISIEAQQAAAPLSWVQQVPTIKGVPIPPPAPKVTVSGLTISYPIGKGRMTVEMLQRGWMPELGLPSIDKPFFQAIRGVWTKKPLSGVSTKEMIAHHKATAGFRKAWAGGGLPTQQLQTIFDIPYITFPALPSVTVKWLEGVGTALGAKMILAGAAVTATVLKPEVVQWAKIIQRVGQIPQVGRITQPAQLVRPVQVPKAGIQTGQVSAVQVGQVSKTRVQTASKQTLTQVQKALISMQVPITTTTIIVPPLVPREEDLKQIGRMRRFKEPKFRPFLRIWPVGEIERAFRFKEPKIPSGRELGRMFKPPRIKGVR